MTKVINPLLERTTSVYNAADRMTQQQFADGSKATMIYNAADRMTRIAHLSSGGSPFDQFDYQYNAAGQKTSVAELSGDRVTWTYDPARQLMSEARSGANAYRHTFTYDAAGNRTVLNEDGSLTTSTYDAANRLRYSSAAAGRTTYMYDANGNQRSMIEPSLDRTTYVWTSQNQMRAVQQPIGDAVTYTWSPVTKLAEERQVLRDDGVDTTRYVWDNQNVVREVQNDTTVEADYTYQPQAHGHLISQYRDSATSIYHFDALGSEIALTQSGVVSDEDRYQAFGKTASSTGTTTNPYQWIGQAGYRKDEQTGLWNLRNRDYGSKQARFPSEDPAEAEPNPYRYVSNNPVNAIDPSGLESYPSQNRGKWIEGTPGNGVFQYDDTPQNRTDGLAGKKVRFTKCSIAIGGFPEEFYYEGNAESASVDLDDPPTGTRSDFTAADKKMREKLGKPDWKRPKGYTWNHAGPPGSKTMELIETLPHSKIHHSGNACQVRTSSSKAVVCTAKRGGGSTTQGCQTTRGSSSVAKGTIVRSIAVLNVYMNLRDALQLSGIAYPDYAVVGEFAYAFEADDGSVFTIYVPGSLNFWSTPYIQFHSGPRAGQVQYISMKDVEEFKKLAEKTWGKYMPGGIFCSPRFVPGTSRKTLPIFNQYGQQTGYVDENGIHEFD